MESEGEAKDLPATLAPEKLVQVVSEKETNMLGVLANLNHRKFLQTNHQANTKALAKDILETRVKVFSHGPTKLARIVSD